MSSVFPKHWVIMSPLVLSVSIFLVVAYLVRTLLLRSQKPKFPVVGSPDDRDMRGNLLKGSRLYPDTPWVLPVHPPITVLPLSCIDEIRHLPENKVSFTKDVNKSFHGKYTGISSDTPAIISSLKKDLTHHLAGTVEALQDEMRYGMDKEFGPCEDWTLYDVLPKILRVVALLSGRVFVGRPISRDEDWIASSINFTLDVVAAREGILKVPRWARFFMAKWIPEVVGARQHKKIGAKLLKPIVEKCMEKYQNAEKWGEEEGDDFVDQQGTFISWLMKYTEEKKRGDPLVLASAQLNLSFAAIHTTTMATTHVLYDLAAHPEYIAPLRAEIDAVIAEDGYELSPGSGVKNLKKQSLPKLKLLDSFMKESQRFSPPILVNNTRITTSPLKLSTGHTLPTDTRISFNAYLINNSPRSTFDDTWDTFNPWRYANLRETPGLENKHQFVTTSKESINFGHGNHACPGRFFAGTEIKVVLVELLRNWDFRFADGRTERPENSFVGVSISPKRGVKMEFRRRKIE